MIYAIVVALVLFLLLGVRHLSRWRRKRLPSVLEGVLPAQMNWRERGEGRGRKPRASRAEPEATLVMKVIRKDGSVEHISPVKAKITRSV